jgi:hypothetical protein
MSIPNHIFVLIRKRLAASRPEMQLLQAGRNFMAVRPSGESQETEAETMPVCSKNTSACGLHKELDKILENLRIASMKMRKESDQECIAESWRFAARVIDRLCLMIFAAAHFASAFMILLPSTSTASADDGNICERKI